MTPDQLNLKQLIEKTWGDYGTYAQIYKDLLIENEDKTLMLKALTSKWRVFRYQNSQWIWAFGLDNDEILDDVQVISIDSISSIPIINDELREIFKKL